eukprot:gene10634-3257_t
MNLGETQTKKLEEVQNIFEALTRFENNDTKFFELANPDFIFIYFLAYLKAKEDSKVIIGYLIAQKIIEKQFTFTEEEVVFFESLIKELFSQPVEIDVPQTMLLQYMLINNKSLKTVQKITQKIKEENGDLMMIYELLGNHLSICITFPYQETRDFFFQLLSENLKNPEPNEKVILCYLKLALSTLIY